MKLVKTVYFFLVFFVVNPVSGRTCVRELPGLCFDPGYKSRASGFFRIERDADRVWRFVTPGGHGFFMAGNNGPSHMKGDECPALGYSPYTRTLESKYGNKPEVWSKDVSTRLLSWGFNAVSSWNRPVPGIIGSGLAHTRVVLMGYSFAKSVPNNESNLLDNVEFRGHFPNVFHPDFPGHCRRRAQMACQDEKDNPWIIGWFTDNEITWRGAVKKDGRTNMSAAVDTGMFDAVMKLPASHSARRALERFLAERDLSSGDVVPASVKRGFLRLVASEYYRITTSAIREFAPNHLVLGCRFAGFAGTPDIAWEEGGKWNDAMSVNAYLPVDFSNRVVRCTIGNARRTLPERLKYVHALSRKPLIVTEWSYPALDAGRPCKFGAGQRVPTQKERAVAAEVFARTLISDPSVIGYAHFRWVDQPALGRWKKKGGEDCNYGLVNEQDESYVLLTKAFTGIHAEMYDIRREGTRRRTSRRPDTAEKGEKGE